MYNLERKGTLRSLLLQPRYVLKKKKKQARIVKEQISTITKRTALQWNKEKRALWEQTQSVRLATYKREPKTFSAPRKQL